MARKQASTPAQSGSSGRYLEHAPFPMAMVEGAMHVVVDINSEFCRLIDRAPDELVGKSFHEILPAMSKCLALLDRVYRSGKSESHAKSEGSDPGESFGSYASWPVMVKERPVAVVIQVVEISPLLEKTLAMNEALVLGLLRQHKSTAAADSSNEQLQTEITDGRQREAEMVTLSMIDPLTGVANRRLLVQALTLEVSRAERTGGQLCACMVDIDHFKRVNDDYGHEAGDKVLVAFGELLRRHTRPTDIVARFGGEEFVVLLSHTNLEHAIVTADRIRQAFAACSVEPLTDSVTASFGVAALAKGEQGDALLRRADKALYVAKNSGRNCVIAG